MESWLIVLIIESLLCLFISILLYYYFIRKDTNYAVSINTVLIWFLTFILIVLLPYDIYFSKSKNIKDDYEKNKNYIDNGINIITTLYSIDYWILFIVSWIVSPIITSYEDSGYFTFKQKIKDSIIRNLLFFIFLGCLLIIGIILVLLLELDIGFLKNMSIGFTISWGLLQVFFFLGYSLIFLPKNLITHFKYENEERYLEWKIQDLRNDLKEIIICQFFNSLENLKLTKNKLNENKESLSNYKNEIDDLINYYEEKKPKYLKDVKLLSFIQDKQYVKNISQLTKLNKKLKIYLIEYERGKHLLKEIYDKWYLVISILNIKGHLKDQLVLLHLKQLSKTKEIYYTNIIPIFKIAFISICIILEMITVWGEIISSLMPLLSSKDKNYDFFSPLGQLIIKTNNLILLHIISFLEIIFLFYLSFYTVFKMKISFLCKIYRNKQTDSLSILYVCKIMSRIGFSICINFCQITNLRDLIINKNYGTGRMIDSENTGLNEAYEIYQLCLFFFPLIIIVLVILNLFNIISRIGNCMGFNSFIIKNEDTENDIIDGENILKEINEKFSGDFDINNYDEIEHYLLN